MTSQKKNPRQRTKEKTQPARAEATQGVLPDEQETVDGILIHISKTDLTISGEQPGQNQRVPAYSVTLRFPTGKRTAVF